MDVARTKSLEEQLEALRIAVAILAGKLDLQEGALVELLNDALAKVREDEARMLSVVH